MTKPFPIKVGQTVCVCVENIHQSSILDVKPITGTICQIGRKYLYVQCDDYARPIPFLKESFQCASKTHKEYYYLFPSEKEFAEKVLHRKYADAIVVAFEGIYRKNISLSALRRVYSILESENVKGLKFVEDSER